MTPGKKKQEALVRKRFVKNFFALFEDRLLRRSSDKKYKDSTVKDYYSVETSKAFWEIKITRVFKNCILGTWVLKASKKHLIHLVSWALRGHLRRLGA